MARGKWWEYLIPGHNVGLMVGDVYDGITGNSEKNAGTGVFGTRKNDSNSYQYAQSNDRVTTAKNNLDYIKGQKPGEYQSEGCGAGQRERCRQCFGPQRRLRQQLGHFQRADGLPEHHERAFGRGRQLIQPGLQRICHQEE